MTITPPTYIVMVITDHHPYVLPHACYSTYGSAEQERDSLKARNIHAHVYHKADTAEEQADSSYERWRRDLELIT